MTARAIEIRAHGGPEVLQPVGASVPEPGPGQLLVEVAAAGVNYLDVHQRRGVRRAPALPFVPGLEGAGVVRAVGAGAAGAVGDHVAWADQQGSYATHVLVAADRAVPVPDGVSDEQAAAVLLQGTTAHYLANDVAPVGDGDWAVVHAAAGGVGLLLTQILTRRGARVLATTSTPAKGDLARAAGAAAVHGYDGLPEAARRVTGGQGVAAVFDGIGAPTLDGSLAALRPRGVLALFGEAGGAPPAVDPQRLNAGGSLWLTRPSRRDYTATRAALLARTEAVLGDVRDGSLDVRVGGRYPLAGAARAHRDLESRRTAGKLLLLS